MVDDLSAQHMTVCPGAAEDAPADVEDGWAEGEYGDGDGMEGEMGGLVGWGVRGRRLVAQRTARRAGGALVRRVQPFCRAESSRGAHEWLQGAFWAIVADRTAP